MEAIAAAIIVVAGFVAMVAAGAFATKNIR